MKSTLIIITFNGLFLIRVLKSQESDTFDLSKVLETLYNKAEANMIKTIKKNLGGRNSIIKSPEVVDCKKRKFGLKPKCLKKDLTQRIRKLEINVKKLRTFSSKKQVKGFNLKGH